MNYGQPNASYQPIIVPSENIKELKARGLPLPARPAWLCIDSPEHCRSGISEKEIPDLKPAQIEEAEAEDLRRQTISLLKANQALEEKRQAKVEADERHKVYERQKHLISKNRQKAKRQKDVIERYSALIIRIREQRKLTQGQLAKALGCSNQSVLNWEKARFAPRPNIQERILAMQ